MQLIQYCHESSFSTVVTNKLIGEEFCLGQASINGYETMGFDVTQLTQDEEQRLFTIKTYMPIPMWGLFPVGKIWSSHSSAKFRFDKP